MPGTPFFLGSLSPNTTHYSDLMHATAARGTADLCQNPNHKRHSMHNTVVELRAGGCVLFVFFMVQKIVTARLYMKYGPGKCCGQKRRVLRKQKLDSSQESILRPSEPRKEARTSNTSQIVESPLHHHSVLQGYPFLMLSPSKQHYIYPYKCPPSPRPNYTLPQHTTKHPLPHYTFQITLQSSFPPKMNSIKYPHIKIYTPIETHTYKTLYK